MTRKLFLSGVAATALLYGAPAWAQLVFEPGEGDFNWASYEAFAEAHDLSGETIEITGPWTGDDARLVNSVIAYFERGDGRRCEFLRLRFLRAGHRDFGPGRFAAQHRGLPAAGPRRRHGVARLPLGAR